MAKIKLTVVESPDPALPVIWLEDERPFATGNGQDDYVCGRCGNGLFLKVDMPVPQAMTIVCGRCGAANLLSDVRDEKPQTSGIERMTLVVDFQLGGRFWHGFAKIFSAATWSFSGGTRR